VARAELISAPGSWATKAPMPTPRRGLVGAVVRNAAGQYIFYTIGGMNWGNPAMSRVEAYNAATNKWTRRASLPAKRAWSNGADVIGGKIYVTGGEDVNGTIRRTVYVYNPATDIWTQRASLPIASSYGVTAAIGGKLYVVTGSSPDRVQPRLYRYDPAKNAWTRLASPGHSHSGGVAGVIDGKLYLSSGWWSTVDVYNPATNRWTTPFIPRVCNGDLFECFHSSAGGIAFNKQLFIIGGGNDDGSLSSVDAYDPTTNAWVGKASMTHEREGRPVAGKVKNAAGQLQIVVVGGFDGLYGEIVTQTEVFTP
jgi:N-acetylneuraminic acid mutarotase